MFGVFIFLCCIPAFLCRILVAEPGNDVNANCDEVTPCSLEECISQSSATEDFDTLLLKSGVYIGFAGVINIATSMMIKNENETDLPIFDGSISFSIDSADPIVFKIEGIVFTNPSDVSGEAFVKSESYDNEFSFSRVFVSESTSSDFQFFYSSYPVSFFKVENSVITNGVDQSEPLFYFDDVEILVIKNLSLLYSSSIPSYSQKTATKQRIWVDGKIGYVEVKDSTFENLQGGIFMFLTVSKESGTNGTIYIKDSIFRNINNIGSYSLGAVMYLTESTGWEISVVVENSEFYELYAINAGGFYFRYVKSVAIESSDFENLVAQEYGGAIYFYQSTSLTVSNSSFNGCRSEEDDGGAIYYYDNNDITVTGSSFVNNFADEEGGGIYVYYTNEMILSGNEFTGNQAYTGGGVYAWESGVELIIEDSSFENNHASDYGGGIYANKNTKVTGRNLLFFGNEAEWGGGLSLDNTDELVLENCSFTKSTSTDGGGAIYAQANSFVGTGLSLHNSTSPYGAGIYLYLCTNLELTDSNFLSNDASSYGGAIFTGGSTAINVNGCKFEDNSGSGIYIGGDYPVNTNIQNSVFKYNRGEYGGAIQSYRTLTVNNGTFISNYAENYGGAIYQRDHDFNCTNSLFEGNIGKEFGGGVYCKGMNSVYGNNLTFTNNEGDSGAGIYHCFVGSIIHENSRFLNNHYYIYGGGISVQNCDYFESRNNYFESNIGEYIYTLYAPYGGGIYLQSISDYAEISDCQFFKGKGYRGGGVYGYEVKLLSLDHCYFEGNFAILYGGGIETGLEKIGVTSGGLTFINNTIFKNNRCSHTGGAVTSETSIIITNCTFEENWSYKCGGAVNIGNYFDEESVCMFAEFKDCKFLNNHVDSYDGASVKILKVPEHVSFENTFFQGDSTERSIELYFMFSGTVNMKNVIITGSSGFYAKIVQEVNIEDCIFEDLDSTVRSISNSPIYFLDCSEFYDESGMTELKRGVDIKNTTFRNNRGKFGGSLGFANNNLFTCTNCIFEDNFSTNKGGAVYVEGVMYRVKYSWDGEISEQVMYPGNILSLSKFKNNSAGGVGGAVYSKGMNMISSIESCVFMGNTAVDGSDVFVEFSFYFKISDSSFSNSISFDNNNNNNNNSSEVFQINNNNFIVVGNGGLGMNTIEHGNIHSVSSALFIVNSEFSDLYGGGVVSNGGFVDLQFLNFTNLKNGRAISLYSQDDTIVNDQLIFCKSIDEYSTFFGLPVGVQKESLQQMILNVSISNSKSSSDGGGILIKDSFCSYDLMNLKIRNSSGGYGGGIYFENNQEPLYFFNNFVENSYGLYGGAISYKNTNILDINGTLQMLTISDCSSVYIGDGVFKFSSEIGNVVEEDFFSKNVLFLDDDSDSYSQNNNNNYKGSTPKELKLFYFQSLEYIEKSFISTNINMSSSELEELEQNINVFPGEEFEIIVLVLDSFGNVINYFPSFEVKVTSENYYKNTENEEEEEEDTVVFVYNDIQTFKKQETIEINKIHEFIESQKEEEEEFLNTNNLKLYYFEIGLKFTGISIKQKNIFENENKKINLIFSSEWIKNDLKIPVIINKCPKGYYINNNNNNNNNNYEICFPCKEGEFSIHNNSKNCLDCPEHATCTSDEVISDQNYWMEEVSDNSNNNNNNNKIIKIHKCHNGKCLEGNNCDGFFDPNHPICGACLDGYSEWNGDCVRCENDFNILYVFLWILLTIFMAMMFHMNSQDPDSSIEKIVSFFGQNSSLITPFIGGLEFIFKIVNFLFSFENVPSPGSKESEICPFKRSSFIRIFMKSFINPTMFFIVFLVFCSFLLFWKICCCRIGVKTPFFIGKGVIKCIFKLIKQLFSILRKKIKKNEDEDDDIFIFNTDTEEDSTDTNSDSEDDNEEEKEEDNENKDENISDNDDEDDDEEENDILFDEELELELQEMGLKDEELEELEEGGESKSESESDNNNDDDNIDSIFEDSSSSTSSSDDSSTTSFDINNNNNNIENIEEEENDDDEPKITTLFQKIENDKKISNDNSEEEKEEKEEKEEENDNDSDKISNENSEEEEENDNNSLEEEEEDEKNELDLNFIIKIIKLLIKILTMPLLLLFKILKYLICGVVVEKLSVFTRLEYFKVTFFNLLVVTYSLFMESSLQYLTCTKFGDNNNRYLRINTDVQCYTGLYFSFFPFFVVLLIYVLLFPLVILLFLLYNRKKVKLSSTKYKSSKELTKKPENKKDKKKNKCCFGKNRSKEEKEKRFIRRYGTMFYSYKENVNTWYEVFSLYRRFFLVFFLTVGRVIDEFIFNFFAMVVLTISFFVHVRCWPYKKQSENIIELMSISTLILLQTLTISNDSDGIQQQTSQKVLLYMVFLPTFSIVFIYKIPILRKIFELFVSGFYCLIIKPCCCCCNKLCLDSPKILLLPFKKCCGFVFSKSKSKKLKKIKQEIIEEDEEDEEDEEGDDDIDIELDEIFVESSSSSSGSTGSSSFDDEKEKVTEVSEEKELDC